MTFPNKPKNQPTIFPWKPNSIKQLAQKLRPWTKQIQRCQAACSPSWNGWPGWPSWPGWPCWPAFHPFWCHGSFPAPKSSRYRGCLQLWCSAGPQPYWWLCPAGLAQWRCPGVPQQNSWLCPGAGLQWWCPGVPHPQRHCPRGPPHGWTCHRGFSCWICPCGCPGCPGCSYLFYSTWRCCSASLCRMWSLQGPGFQGATTQLTSTLATPRATIPKPPHFPYSTELIKF